MRKPMSQSNNEGNRTIQQVNPKLKLDKHEVIESNEAAIQLMMEIQNKDNKYNNQYIIYKKTSKNS